MASLYKESELRKRELGLSNKTFFLGNLLAKKYPLPFKSTLPWKSILVLKLNAEFRLSPIPFPYLCNVICFSRTHTHTYIYIFIIFFNVRHLRNWNSCSSLGRPGRGNPSPLCQTRVHSWRTISSNLYVFLRIFAGNLYVPIWSHGHEGHCCSLKVPPARQTEEKKEEEASPHTPRHPR